MAGFVAYCYARLVCDVGKPGRGDDVIKLSVEKLISVLKSACKSSQHDDLEKLISVMKSARNSPREG